MTNWKNAERRVARLFGSERTGPTGRDDVDFIHPYLLPEVKYRAKLPQWALDCLQQSREAKSAAGTGKLPCAFLLQKGMRLEDGLVVMRIADFKEIVGKIV